MDISSFRWILIIVGVLIIAGIFVLGNPEKKPRRRASRKQNRRRQAPERREPTLDKGTPPSRFDEEPAAEAAQGELQMDTGQAGPGSSGAAAGPPPDKIVTLYLQARDNHRISGVELLDAALKSGMVFGARDIFHRVLDDGDQPIFSMANLTSPGWFDKTAWNTLETRGVTLFMTLPGPMGALDAWDAMLATSRRLGELLHADLLDQSHTVFTRQREGEIREELRKYERDQLPEE